MDWVRGNLLTEMMLKAGRLNVKRILYEDFCHSPQETLTQIGLFAGINMVAVSDKVEKNEPIHPFHLLAGNRIRMRL